MLPGNAIATEAASQREYPIGDGLAGAPRYTSDEQASIDELANAQKSPNRVMQ
jgi:hypothetical protein